jgi:hypothetical protein
VRVKFGEEFCEEGRVLRRDGKDPEPPLISRRADNVPSNLTLATRARVLTGPEEGPSPLIDSFDNPGGEKPSSHCMGNHSSENGVDKK